MSDSAWQRLRQLFDEALEQPPGERDRFLAEACGDDRVLLQELRELVAGHAAAGPLDRTRMLTRLLAEEIEAEAELPPAIGPYVPVRVLGEGGMGVVFAAEQKEPIERQVAIKLVKAGLDSREVVRRFESERQALARMEHPNIARIHDGGATDQGRPYFVMELVQGASITTYCDQHRLSLRRRLELVLPVCRAVQHAHQRGIIHRDLKPSNILVTETDGEPLPKVIDFGVAKAIEAGDDEGEMRTRAGQLVGTPAYMSPEQRALSGDIDTRSDVYSLGILLYQLLIGTLPPFATAATAAGEEDRRTAEALETGTPSLHLSNLGERAIEIAELRATELRGLQRQLRGELDRILLKAAAVQREERYQSPSELAADIERYLEGRPVLAVAPSLGYRARKFVRRHWAATATAAAALALLLGFGIAMALQSARLSRALEATEEQRQKAEEVSAFLMSLFRGLNPYRVNEGGLGAREILDRGSARLEEELANQPQVQAELRQILAMGYRGLGIYDRSQVLFEQNLEAQRELYGAEHAKVASALAELGVYHREVHELDRAEDLLHQALAMFRRVGETEHVTPRFHLATVLWQKGAYDEADELLQEALQLQQEQDPEEHGMLGELLQARSVVHLLRGQNDEAVALARQALVHRREEGGRATTGGTLALLGSILSEKGELDAAEPLLREGLELERQDLGTSHPRVATTANNLALLLHRMGKLDEAAVLYEEASAIEREVFGEEYSSAVGLHNRALLAEDRGRLAEAATLLREAIRVQQSDGSEEEHPNLAYPLSSLARVLHAQEDLAESAALYQRGLELRRRTLPEDHPALAASLLGYGALLVDHQDPQAALPLLREGLEILRRSVGPDDGRTANAESLVGAALTALGHFEEAETLLLRSYRQIAAERPAGDRRTEAARQRVLSLYERWGKPEELARFAGESRPQQEE